MATFRQKKLAEALTLTIPRAPFADAQAIRERAGSRRLRDVAPRNAVWLAVISHIRHNHTDYDVLLDEGYDREAARFFVLDNINAVLREWGARRSLDPEGDGEETAETTDDRSGID